MTLTKGKKIVMETIIIEQLKTILADKLDANIKREEIGRAHV